MSRKSFIVYLDLLDSLDELSDAQAGKLFKTIKAYHRSVAAGATQECVANFEGLLKDFVNRLAFAPFRAAFERDAEKYQDKCRRYSENGKKGGRPRKEESDGFSRKPELTTAFSKKQSVFEKAKKADNVNDNVNVEDKSSYPHTPKGGGDGGCWREKLRERFFSKQMALESFCMSNHISQEELRQLAEEVFDEWELASEKDLSERHLINTLRVKINIRNGTDKQKQNISPSGTKTVIRSKLPPEPGYGLIED